MAFLSIIRRWALGEHLSIREIARRTKLSRSAARPNQDGCRSHGRPQGAAGQGPVFSDCQPLCLRTRVLQSCSGLGLRQWAPSVQARWRRVRLRRTFRISAAGFGRCYPEGICVQITQGNAELSRPCCAERRAGAALSGTVARDRAPHIARQRRGCPGRRTPPAQGPLFPDHLSGQCAGTGKGQAKGKGKGKAGHIAESLSRRDLPSSGKRSLGSIF